MPVINKVREVGYYRVKDIWSHKWEIAKWDGASWHFTFDRDSYEDCHLEAIDAERINEDPMLK